MMTFPKAIATIAAGLYFFAFALGAFAEQTAAPNGATPRNSAHQGEAAEEDMPESKQAHEAAHQGEAAVEQTKEIPLPSEFNAMHPPFVVLDADGAHVLDSGKAMDEKKTCGACHDVDYIRKTLAENKGHDEANCLQCHSEQTIDGWSAAQFHENGEIKREYLSLLAPMPENCANCHGIIHTGDEPLSLPHCWDKTAPDKALDCNMAMTKYHGEIISGQMIEDSFLNVEDKAFAHFPWDVHAARLVTCSACHATANNPQHMQGKKSAPKHLANDPRRMDVQLYVKRPDHALISRGCEQCHNPLIIHEALPYKKRHTDKLSCESCHIAKLRAPVLKKVDWTIITDEGDTLVEYWNKSASSQEAANARFVKVFEPFLLPSEDEKGKIAPYNLVTHRFWMDEASGMEVPSEFVIQAYLQEPRNKPDIEKEKSGKLLEAREIEKRAYHADILKAFDDDGDGALTMGELQLTSEKKRAAVVARLKKLGVQKPVITEEVRSYAINHGVAESKQVKGECTSCHGVDSRFNTRQTLTTKDGLAAKIRIEDFGDGKIADCVKETEEGVEYDCGESLAGFYVLGTEREHWSDTLGIIAFVMTALGVMGHALYRIATRKKRQGHPSPTKKAYLYTLYERLWHWLMAGMILLLILTGLEIHNVGVFTLFGFKAAVTTHNIAAAILIINAILSAFYHLASAEIKQFIPKKETLIRDIFEQAKFYLNGIFAGEPHPIAKTEERKLNPLQQLTYMGLLNVLFPFQVITGILIWGIGGWPVLEETIGGLEIVTPLHNLGSWLFITFLTAHLYLITTGHSLGSNLKAMITGYDEIDMVEEQSHKTKNAQTKQTLQKEGV